MSLTYRQDLNSVRAIAILGVLFFHLKFGSFQGGFVGVDIFFVLSGFLMTAILEDAQGTKREVLKDFYIRRIRRIVPLSISVLLVTAAVVSALFSPLQIKSFLPHFIGAATFVSNVTFWWENSYFSDDLFRPNLHYWSLGVEVQYYLVFPFFVLFLKWKKLWFMAIFVVAEVAAYWMTSLSAKTAFFLLPFRMGEFMVGSFVYYALQLPFFRQPSKWNDLWLAGGLIATIAPFVMFDRNTPFPHIYVMIPTLGAAALILFGGRSSMIAVAYDNWLFRHIGKISFSIYLWHYPVIFIVTRYFELEIGWLVTLVIIAITVALSELSYAFIEDPFRRKSVISPRTLMRSGMAVTALTAIFTVAILQTNGFAFRYPKNIQAVYTSMEDRDAYRCGKLKRLTQPFTHICILHDAPHTPAKVLLWGDSHADSLKPAFHAVAQEGHFSFYLNKANCSAGDMQGDCAENAQVFQDIVDTGITDVVLHSSVSGFAPEFHDNFERVVSRLTELNIQVHVIYPVPVFSAGAPQNILRVLNEGGENVQLDFTVHQYRSTIQSFTMLLDRLKNAFPNVHYYETFPYLCPDSTCRPHENYRVYYFDSHHLTRFGASKLSPLIRAAFPKSTIASTLRSDDLMNPE